MKCPLFGLAFAAAFGCAAPHEDAATVGSLEFADCEGAFGARRFGVDVECTTITVPLHWDRPDGREIDIAVERIAPAQEVAAQLWFLQGGPGASGLSFEQSAAELQGWLPNVELLFLDHRGTGLSSRLGCPAQESADSPAGTTVTESEWASCIEELRARYSDDDLAGYSTTNAARDVGELIERARRPDVPVFVYSISYGTYWAQRWLQLFPDQADGVILDSISSPSGTTFPLGASRDHDEVGRELLRACAADPVCAQRFGSDPVGRAEDIVRAFDGGHCPALHEAGMDSERLRSLLGLLLREHVRGAIPALLHRIDRCTEEDVRALSNAIHTFEYEIEGGESVLRAFSPMLNLVVVRSELWDSPSPTEEQYEESLTRSRFAVTLGPGTFESWESAPRYEPDAWVGRFAETDIPMLMMNGTLDPQTTLRGAMTVAARFDGPHQSFVPFERATHGILMGALYEESASGTCGSELLRAFVADPRAPLDTSCRTETSRLDFDDDWSGTLLFGGRTLW